MDAESNLIVVIKRTKMAVQKGIVNFTIGTEEPFGTLDRNASVSMNYWGLHPEIFEQIEKGLHNFMKLNANNPTAECYIPSTVRDVIVGVQMTVRIIPINDNWFGVTYKQDKPMAINAINAINAIYRYVTDGVYTTTLWSCCEKRYFYQGQEN